ncbi:MAG: hypothetical protein E3J56_00990 [Candidatus Aminicenantes bacterium]|nr:MAG: hypothetical protein E3J56_00990 [Candidatus Aminicenantes bacterium]
MKKFTIPILIAVAIFLAALVAATYNFQTMYNPFSGKLDYHITGNMSGENITADYFVGNASQLLGTISLANSSDFWDDLDIPDDIVYSDLYTSFWDANVNIGAHNFSVDGSVFFVDATNNRVGIGTSSPEGPLHVYKSAAAMDAIGGSIILNRYLSAGSWRGAAIFSYYPSAAGRDSLAFAVSGSLTPLNITQVKMVILDTGKVGINTTSPQNLLNVLGDINATGTIYGGTIDSSTLDGYDSLFFMPLNQSLYNNFDFNAFNLTAEMFIDSTDGIEWIRPEHIFDVDDADIETDLNTYVDIAGDTMTGDLTGTNFILGPTSLITFGNSLRLISSDDTLTFQNTQADTRAIIRVMPKGTETFPASALEFFGTDFIADSTNYERLRIYAGSTYQISTHKAGNGTLRPLILFTDGNANQLYLSTAGLVGIGTSTPQNKLNVIGDGNFTGNLYGGIVYSEGGIVYLKSNPFTFWNSTFATFNKTYADTLYVYTAGDALTLTGNDFDFDGGASPGGELGGTWASPTIDSGIHDDEYIELGDSFGGEVSGTYGSIVLDHNALDDQYWDAIGDWQSACSDCVQAGDIGDILDASHITDIYVFDAGDTMAGALVAADHGAATADEVVNVVYTTATCPAASGTTIGTLCIVYTA